ncbi:MAG TPA: phage terminase large subunit family protein [Nocardioides sp.]|nr:phage terminase large subunit family protein [Nocardioides sp.]
MSGAISWPSYDGAAPRFATRRNLERPSDGDQVAIIARRLGTPLTPWQRYVADVAGELREDGSYEYQVVVVTVPRQTGKTTLIRAIGTKSALFGRDTFYTAQTGKDARARWMDLVKILRNTPAFRDRVKVALRGGSEHVEFPGGGVFQCFAPTPESLHGYTPPRVFIDEAFAQSAASGELLIGAIEPAQQTITDKQLWIVSTMGTDDSTFLHDWIDRARAGVPRVALFDWGASDHHDPFNPADIADFHPGVGMILNGKMMTAADVLSASDKMSRAEYVRAYANRRTSTLAQLVTTEAWRARTVTNLEPPADLRRTTLAYDVDEHATTSAIVAVWTDPATGLPAVQLVRREPGVAWLAAGVLDLAREWRVTPVAARTGPVLDVSAELRAAGQDVDELDEREYAAASTGLLRMIRDAGLVHAGRQGDELETSVTGLATRDSGDGGVALSRRHSSGSPSAGIALALALHRHRHQPARKPMVRFG